ncbi:tigger transposable element-derived protein 1-like [Hydra vulgaris]|uniref:Tigger transposable element-derived protein 1-like n=1 Tax=Hydra vulgaris TaxID=6087 RepID=A0ABM4B9D2_HYDVU
MANKKAWVTTAIFTEWFDKCIVPEVKKYMKEKRLEFKILIILDNAPGHANLEYLNIELAFFPSNTTGLIQLLDQGIISTFKNAHPIMHLSDSHNDYLLAPEHQIFQNKDLVKISTRKADNLASKRAASCTPELIDRYFECVAKQYKQTDITSGSHIWNCDETDFWVIKAKQP